MYKKVLYRYSPESESEESQLINPNHKRERVLKEHHDAPTAEHYGDGAFNKIV